MVRSVQVRSSPSSQFRFVRLGQVDKLRSGRSAQFRSWQVDLGQIRSVRLGQVRSDQISQFKSGRSGQVNLVGSGRSDQTRSVRSGHFTSG